VTVFLDTVGLLALWDESDQWHTGARRAFEELTISRSQLVTTLPVILECGNAAARRPYRSAVSRLREKLQNVGKLIIPTEEDWKLAWKNYDTGKGEAAGIVDQSSFVVMERLGITNAFTNDVHFRAAGFKVLF
jgi:predicted nucleic acid-binding protein